MAIKTKTKLGEFKYILVKSLKPLVVITETSFSAGPLKTIETEKSLFSGQPPIDSQFWQGP